MNPNQSYLSAHRWPLRSEQQVLQRGAGVLKVLKGLRDQPCPAHLPEARHGTAFFQNSNQSWQQVDFHQRGAWFHGYGLGPVDMPQSPGTNKKGQGLGTLRTQGHLPERPAAFGSLPF
ncbi:unnamed protein product [Boreogadus saida]